MAILFLPYVQIYNEREIKMEDNFDYSELLKEMEMLDELIKHYEQEKEENICNFWTQIYINEEFAIFVNDEGETRLIHSNYLNKLFN